MKNQTMILRAIADVIGRSSIYTEAKGIVEVEKLYLLEKGLDRFLQIVPVSVLDAGERVTQEDYFYDIPLKGRWQLADTDHYIRLRTVHGKDGRFVNAEIKISYPGPLSNPNARYSPAEKLTEKEVEDWGQHLKFLGLEVERQYQKQRVPCICKQKYDGFTIEIEADRFEDEPFNGPLAARSFVSISIETEGPHRESAEEVLLRAKQELETTGVALKECEGNYEDYFYGRKILPKAKEKT
jgi:adenylate cyclase class IV